MSSVKWSQIRTETFGKKHKSAKTCWEEKVKRLTDKRYQQQSKLDKYKDMDTYEVRQIIRKEIIAELERQRKQRKT